MSTVESNFSNFVIEYLGEIETEFKNILACLSGAQMGSNHEKNWRLKILWHTPFKKRQKLMHFWDVASYSNILEWGRRILTEEGHLILALYILSSKYYHFDLAAYLEVK